LYEQYHTLGKSTTEMAKIAGVCSSTIHNHLKKNNIKTRGPSEARDYTVEFEKLAEKSWLEKEYSEKQKTTRKIASGLGCTSTTVVRWLNEHNIPTREAGGSDTPFDRLANYDWVFEHYVNKNESITDIAKIIGCSPAAVWNAVQRHNIQTRVKEMPSGEDHPNWKGGRVGSYGPSWPRQREKALERANYKCEHTGMTQKRHKELFGGQGLNVHHIRPFREFGVENHREANKLSNLRVLTVSEHRRWERIPTLPVVSYD
jgi:transposase-like protein